MPLSSTYYESLKTKAEADATAKKAAYDAALARATAVEFDEKGNVKTDASGNPIYKTDAAGTKLQGSLDVAYANQQRSTGAGAEASGMLRSGQLARARTDDLTTYRANLMGAMGEAQAGKTTVDTGLARQLAEYKAQYGPETSSGTGSSSSGTTGGNQKTDTTGKDDVLAPTPTPKFTGTPTPSTSNTGDFRKAEMTTQVTNKPAVAPKPVTKKPGTVVLKPGRNIR